MPWMDEDVSPLSSLGGGVSMATRSWFPLFPMQTHALMASQVLVQCVSTIPEGIWWWPRCRWSCTPGIHWSPPPRACPGYAWPGSRRHRTFRMGPVASLCCNICPNSSFPVSVGIWTPTVRCRKNQITQPASSPRGRLPSGVPQLCCGPCRWGSLLGLGWTGDSVLPWYRQWPKLWQPWDPLLGTPETTSHTSCVVVEGHCAVGIDEYQVTIMTIGFGRDGCRQRLGESQADFHGAQAPGGQVGHTLAVIRHQVQGQQHTTTHEPVVCQVVAPHVGVHAAGFHQGMVGLYTCVLLKVRLQGLCQ